MSSWSRKRFYALATCAAASLTAGAGATTAAMLPGMAIKASILEKNVLTVGYDGYGDRPDYYAADYDYYSYDRPSPPSAGYDYDNPYAYSNSYDYPDYEESYYERWPSYTSEPDRYYGTRAPVEAYEKDEHYVWQPPSRPRSCGEHHYWTGFSCVDARHFKPYVGPKW